MLLKTSKKKSVFSKLMHVKKFALSLDTEYIEKITISDEDHDNTEVFEKHIILVKIPIDKVSAIKSKLAHIEGFVCKEFDHLRSRQKLLSGFNQNSTKSLNFAILNQELLARDALQNKLQNAGMTKVFGINIGSNLLADIKISDIIENKKPYIDIFGYKEVIEISSKSNFSQSLGKNKSRKDLFSLRRINKNSGEIENFKSFEDIKQQNLAKSSISKINFKREFNRCLRAGTDPAKLISNSFYSGQSLDQMLKGRLQKNIKSKENFQNFGNKFHNLVAASISSSDNNFAIKKTKIEKTHETIPIKIEISDKILKESGSNTFDIVVYARNTKKRIIDYYTLKVDLDKLINRKRLIQQSVDLKKHSIMCQRSSRDKAVLKIHNNSRNDASYRVLHASINSKNLKNNYFFDKAADVTKIQPGQKIYVFNESKGPTLSRYKHYLYRMKVSYGGMNFDNTFFDNISSRSKNSKLTSSKINIVCINDSDVERVRKQESVRITIDNFPFDCIALNIVKRNLTKKEKNFELIKNYNQTSTNLQSEESLSFLSLKTQQTIFLNKNHPRKSLVFFDNDIEEGDVYEYKAMLYKDNCETELSINSYEMKYEKRKSIVSVRLSSKTSITTLPKDSFLMKVSLSVSVEKDSIDKLFESIDRNSYELFSKEFDDIKEALRKNISCSINLINTDSGETFGLGDFPVNEKDKSVKVSARITSILDNHIITVTPRIASTAYIIENLLNKIELLPNVQRTPISSFLRILTIKKNENRQKPMQVSSVPVSKYTSKSIRFFGLILDPITKFNLEKDDFYFEGSTGDNFIFNVYNPNSLQSIVSLKMESLIDLSHQQNNHGNGTSYNKMAILKMKSAKANQLVNFYAIYYKTNGSINFLGMISPERFNKKQYSFYADLENTVGVAEIYCVTILKDGTFLNPTHISNLLCTAKSIKVV